MLTFRYTIFELFWSPMTVRNCRKLFSVLVVPFGIISQYSPRHRFLVDTDLMPTPCGLRYLRKCFLGDIQDSPNWCEDFRNDQVLPLYRSMCLIHTTMPPNIGNFHLFSCNPNGSYVQGHHWYRTVEVPLRVVPVCASQQYRHYSGNQRYSVHCRTGQSHVCQAVLQAPHMAYGGKPAMFNLH